jgi:hypothetical protein
MAESLTEFMQELLATPPEGFEPGCFYSPEEDSLTCYFRNAESYGRRLDEFLTLFLSFDGDEVVGCQVKGVRRKIVELESVANVHILQNSTNLGLLLHFLAFVERQEEPRRRYMELGQATKDVSFNFPPLMAT